MHFISGRKQTTKARTHKHSKQAKLTDAQIAVCAEVGLKKFAACSVDWGTMGEGNAGNCLVDMARNRNRKMCEFELELQTKLKLQREGEGEGERKGKAGVSEPNNQPAKLAVASERQPLYKGHVREKALVGAEHSNAFLAVVANQTKPVAAYIGRTQAFMQKTAYYKSSYCCQYVCLCYLYWLFSHHKVTRFDPIAISIYYFCSTAA